jgi:hypothetical protein
MESYKHTELRSGHLIEEDVGCHEHGVGKKATPNLVIPLKAYEIR